MATGAAPIRASSAVRPRPRAGWTPRTVKKSFVTTATSARVGSAVPATDATTPGVLRHGAERPVAVPEIHEVRVGEPREGAAGVDLPDGHQTLRLRVRQRPQHDAVDDAEDGGRGPDREGEREHRDRGRRQVPHEHAGGQTKVENQRSHRQLLQWGIDARAGRSVAQDILADTPSSLADHGCAAPGRPTTWF